MRYPNPETLARNARAPLVVCRLIFAVAEGDEENIRLIRAGALDEETIRQRWAVVLVARLYAGANLEEIGRALNVDHSSVKRAIDGSMQKWLEDDRFRHICGKLTMDRSVPQRVRPWMCAETPKRRKVA
jgi:hypothetical protein